MSHVGHIRSWHYHLLASGLATSRACWMKSCVTGLSVRFFRVSIPIGTEGSGSSTGKTLNWGRVVGNFNLDVEKIDRKRPVANKLIRTSAGMLNTVARG